MRKIIFIAFLLMYNSSFAASIDNAKGVYVIMPLPSASAEAKRMDRTMQLSDQQPSGRYLRAGESLTVSVRGVLSTQQLWITVGFSPMYGIEQYQQEVRINNGVNTFVAEQDGPFFFRLTSSDELINTKSNVKIEVYGGRPLPLFVEGTSDVSEWQNQLLIYQDAPFVQLISHRAILTLPMNVHNNAPIENPESTLATINYILDLQNNLAGFDGLTLRDNVTPLRNHFLVDFRASEADREQFYMYATDGFIGMQSYNTQDLTDPRLLSTEWGVWHEVGHTHQQKSWTWDSLTEISVNLFSLYVQEKMGKPSRLSLPDENGISPREQAEEYIARQNKNYLHDKEDEYFVKLVMFEKIKDRYGWTVFTQLFKRMRSEPLPADVNESEKVDAFIISLCELTGDDLRPFFASWGLYPSEKANRQIDGKRR